MTPSELTRLRGVCEKHRSTGWFHNMIASDEKFLAEARSAMPKLIDEVERLKEEIEALTHKGRQGELEQGNAALANENARLREALEHCVSLMECNPQFSQVTDSMVLGIAREALGGG
jgi:hypothetical protein